MQRGSDNGARCEAAAADDLLAKPIAMIPAPAKTTPSANNNK
jgi:hypothetical protein